MANKKTKTTDSTYFLKLVVLLILGSLWIKASNGENWQLPIPIGLIIGLVIVTHEHFKIDRKIEYAVLLMAMLIGFWAPIGLFISI